MSDILKDLEIFDLGDGTFKHREEDTYAKKERKRGFFGKTEKSDAFESKEESESSKEKDTKAVVEAKALEENKKDENLAQSAEKEKIAEDETAAAVKAEEKVEKKIEKKIEDKVEDKNEEKTDKRLRYDASGLDERILKAVSEMGFEYMSPIQEAAIPVMLQGKDIIGQAQTGTGKTAAFGIPVLSLIDPENKHLQAVILCPTRELAMQAADDIRDFAKYMYGVKILSVYGGQDIMRQIKALSSGVQIVVGTPGRVMDHMRRHTIKMQEVKLLVLDEADEMLDMGFREDIETILQGMPEERQTALFSATMPKPILEITKQYQKADAEYIRMSPKEITVKSIEQSYYVIPREMKFDVLTRLLDYYQPQRSLIFANTKRMVDQMASMLKERGYMADGLHGDLSQNQRDMVMNIFRNGRINILIATDVAARGIDVSGVDCVFNFDIPDDIEYYVHRIGRTGRAGKSGRSFTLVSGREVYKIRDIERICHTSIEERQVPSAKSITKAKSLKVFAEVIDVIENGDITSTTEFVQKKVEEGEYTAEQLAAGFMRLKMGKDVEDIKIPERRSRGSRDGRNDRDGRGGRGGRGEGRSFMGRDGKKHFEKDGRRFGRDGHGRTDRDGADKDGKRSFSRDDSRKRFDREDRRDRRPRDGKREDAGAGRLFKKEDGARRDDRPMRRDDRPREDRPARRDDRPRDERMSRGDRPQRSGDRTGRRNDRSRNMRVERSDDRFYGGVAIKTRGNDGKFHQDND